MELRRNAQNLKSDSPRAVIDNLREYMIFKNREELAVVKFIFDHLKNDYIETLAKPNAQLSDIDSPSRASEVCAQLWRNPQIRQFFFGQQQQGRGQGLKPPKTIIIPVNKNDLLDRLRVIIAAKHAGHSDVEDEKNAIFQRLLEKKHITEKDYKKFSRVKLSL